MKDPIIIRIVPFGRKINQILSRDTDHVIFFSVHTAFFAAAVCRQDASSSGCPRTSDWFRLWLDVYQFATDWRLQCWAENIMLVHDFADGKNKNVEGVETRVPGWGETETLERIDPRWRGVGMCTCLWVCALVCASMRVCSRALEFTCVCASAHAS